MKEPSSRENILALRHVGYTDEEIAGKCAIATSRPVAKSTIWRIRTGIHLPRRRLALALLRIARRYGARYG